MKRGTGAAMLATQGMTPAANTHYPDIEAGAVVGIATRAAVV
jgi:hypothetical protein